MAYIPTIHTFEDDVNENRGFDEAPISGGLDKINYGDSMLVPEKSSSSITKKILTLISTLFIIGSISILGYYFYNKYKANQLNNTNNQTLNENQSKSNEQALNNDLKNILPTLSSGISQYIDGATMKNNIIILTIKNNTTDSVDNYSLIYAYILAHTKDLNSDLFSAFNIDDLAKSISNDYVDNENISTTSTSTNNKNPNTLEKIGDVLNGNNIQNEFSKIIKPTPISSQELTWESKTLKNQDFEVTTAGVINLVYGYVGQKYIVFTTSLKDFFDTVDSLQ